MRFAVLFVLAALAISASIGVAQAGEKDTGTKMLVGTFDSRAVAMAYYQSEIHAKYIKDLKAEYAIAKAAGDEERVRELTAEGEASQELAHKQCFSTWPVDKTMERIGERIPEIAEEAGVDVIVSKWDIIYMRPEADFIDVTFLMMLPLNSDEEAMKELLQELAQHDPIPLEELSKHQH